MSLQLRIKLDNENAKAPTRMSTGAAGYDLYSCEDMVIAPNTRKLVDTGIRIAIPENTYARIAPRSGLSVKGIDIGAGVVDYDYRGIVKVLMINNSTLDFTVLKGDRIAQMVIEKITTPDVIVVDDIESTERGAGGFGSTGI